MGNGEEMPEVGRASTPRVGLLYPTRDCGEDDFVRMAALLDPSITVEFSYVEWGEDVSDIAEMGALEKLNAVRELGEPDRLAVAAAGLTGFAPHVVALACSSCSFLQGLDGARKQAADLAALMGAPATGTSLAFVAAARAMGLSRVGLASVYGEEVTSAFAEFLADAGITTTHHVAMDAPSDRALASWDRHRIADLTERGDGPDAEAVLVPETALHTADLVPGLERRLGKPVLTATQVTIWHALVAAGHPARGDGAGALFARAR
ncbi:decarboxylase [Actinoallomurus iriomotensis]|uniref:Decarboxylase n=2 Tax=Actinoallomurus iriomotensis TaxID=478107 RepID=A0A9W6RGM5_9ACTN|nr:decarboxylase [Actinoallomurus iriomotensis]